MLWHVVSAAVDLQWGKKSCKNYQSTNIPTKFTFNWTSGFGKDDDKCEKFTDDAEDRHKVMTILHVTLCQAS